MDRRSGCRRFGNNRDVRSALLAVRIGFIVASKEAGAADSDIAATTRHKSLQVIKRREDRFLRIANAQRSRV